MGAAIPASAVLQRQRADKGCTAEQQAGSDRHGKPRQRRHAGLRVHDKVGLRGRPRIQHVAPGCRPQSEEDAKMTAANRRTLTLAAIIFVLAMGAPAQTNYAAEAARNPGAASRPTPRMADGHPDLNGVWHHFFGIGTIEKVGDSFVVGGAFNPKNAKLYTTPLGDAKPEYKPEFAAKVKSLYDNQVNEDTTLHCIP